MREYVTLVREIESEPVLVICKPSDTATVTRELSDILDVRYLQHPIDDGWIRDNGPIGALEGDKLVAVDFRFNSWGGRFAPWDGDESVGAAVASSLLCEHRVVDFVLEGGAISFNGRGVATVVEECVLNPSRNGVVSRADFESIVFRALGVHHVIWLPYGILEDLDNTDGHVDNVAVWIGEDHVLVQLSSPDNVNFPRLSANLETLAGVVLGDGRQLRTVVPHLPYAEIPNGRRQPAPYINFVFTNHKVLVPSVGDVADPARRNISISDTAPQYSPGPK